MAKKNFIKIKKIIPIISIIVILVPLTFAEISCNKNFSDTSGATYELEVDQSLSKATIINNKQLIEVVASSWGYSPVKIKAKAGISTILVIRSEGAYGCERAFNIPKLNVSEILPENGQTKFDLGVQEKGTKLLGVCSMGMYYFLIFFS